MNEIWQIVEPYIFELLKNSTLCALVAAIIKIILNRSAKKIMTLYDTDVLASKVADKSAEKLAGKTIDIDISELVDDRLKKTFAVFESEFKRLSNELKAYKPLLIGIGSALMHLKMLTDDEREALGNAVKALDSSYILPDKQVITTIKLEPIAVEPPVYKPIQEQTQSSAVNFG